MRFGFALYVFCFSVSSLLASDLESYIFPPRQEDRKGVRTEAFLVSRAGELVYERYSDGFGPERPHLLWSVTKSFAGLMIGMAIQDKILELDDVIIPSPAHPVRVRDALSWSSGLDWNETYEYNPLRSSVIQMLYSTGRGDMFDYVRSIPVKHLPGKRFWYSSGDSVLLMGYLQSKMSAEDYANYPWKKLFEPLGMTSAVWERDPKGVFVGSSYLYLSPQDLKTFGDWLLKERQSGPLSNWIKQTTQISPSFSVRSKDRNYLWPGLHWWVNGDDSDRLFEELPADLFAGLGHWGQSISFIPSMDLVIIRLADDRESEAFSYREMIRRVIDYLERDEGQR